MSYPPGHTSKADNPSYVTLADTGPAPELIAFDGRMRRRRSQMTGIGRGNDLIQSMHAGDDIMTAAGYLRSLAAVLPFEPDPPQG